MKHLLRRTLLLALMTTYSLSLTACQTKPAMLSPVVTSYGSLNYAATDFVSRWSPDGKRIAIRSSYESTGYGSLSGYLTPYGADEKDTINLYSAETGKRLDSWELTYQRAFREQRLQWAEDGSRLYVLRGRYAQDLLQGLILNTYTPGQSQGELREIFIPDSLKDLSTLRFEHPALSPDGKQLSLMRVFKTEAGSESSELILLNLAASRIESRTALRGLAIQSAAWGKNGSYFVMTRSGQEPLIQLWQIAGETQQSLMSVWSSQGSFMLSPNRSRVLVSYWDEHARPVDPVQLPEVGNDPDDVVLNGVMDLADKKPTWFRSNMLLRLESHQEQAGDVWDQQSRVNYQLIESNPKQFLMTSSRIEAVVPGQGRVAASIDLAKPEAAIDQKLRPLLNRQERTRYRSTFPLLLSHAPNESRALLRLNQSGEFPVSLANVFYIWDSQKSQLLPLESKLDLLLNPLAPRVSL